MKERPDHHDAELVLKCYDLRREAVMRQSRDFLNGQFWPKSYEEFLALTQPTHDRNAAFRQVSTYWEMVYSFVRQGVVHAEFFVENNGEGLFFYSKIQPYIERFRKEVSPTAFTNTEWVASNTEIGKARVELMKKRIATMMQNK